MTSIAGAFREKNVLSAFITDTLQDTVSVTTALSYFDPKLESGS